MSAAKVARTLVSLRIKRIGASFILSSILCIFAVFLKGTDGRSMELKGTVGFASLPDQLVNKSVAKGFDFNILCVGKEDLQSLLMILKLVLMFLR